LIFIPSIVTGKREIVQTFISFKDIESLTEGNIEKKEYMVASKILQRGDDNSRLSISVKNKSLKFIKNLEVSAALKDKNGNVIDVGRSFIEYIGKRDEGSVEIT
jgi:hypothetical protein